MHGGEDIAYLYRAQTAQSNPTLPKPPLHMKRHNSRLFFFKLAGSNKNTQIYTFFVIAKFEGTYGKGR